MSLYVADHSCPRCGSEVHVDITTLDEGEIREVEFCAKECGFRLYRWEPASDDFDGIRSAVVAVADLVRRGEPLPERRAS